MNLQPLSLLTDDEQMLFQSTLDFAKKEVKPHVEQMDELEKMTPHLIQKCFEMGFMGVEVPEIYGGAGSHFFNAILIIQALAQVDPSVSVFVDVQNTLVCNALLRWANEEQKKKYLPQLCSTRVGSYCLTEPASGSDAFALKTTAKEEGEFYRLNGKKVFITNALEAEIFLVFANVNLQLGYKGITAFILEKGHQGFSLGKKEKKLGIRASSTCELIFEDCLVQKNQMIGGVGQGYKIAIETLNEGRIGIAAQMLGLAEGAFHGALNYCKQREQFGKTLDKFQGIQFQLAEMATDIEASRLMVYNAARLKDAGLDFVKEAAMAKVFSANIAESVSSLALELYGGYGFIKEFPIEKFFRDSKIGKIYEGTSNMQLQTIAKLIC